MFGVKSVLGSRNGKVRGIKGAPWRLEEQQEGQSSWPGVDRGGTGREGVVREEDITLLGSFEQMGDMIFIMFKNLPFDCCVGLRVEG